MKSIAYRDNGAIGALLDEYERSISELREVIKDLSCNDLMVIVDNVTEDLDCRSVQTILSHVVRAGYNYVIEIRNWKGENLEFRDTESFGSIADYDKALSEMFQFNLSLFSDYPALKIEEHFSDKKINVRWGQKYDVEQLLEHAIVHVLRHRRQIERFMLKLHDINLKNND
jgi:hypothetical protein